MNDEGPEPESSKSTFGILGNVLICLVVLAIGGGITRYIFSSEPVAQREGATRKSAMLVEVAVVKRDVFRPTIVETGVVAPAREIQLSPQVGGPIIEVHPDFVPGGIISKGEVVFRIQPADYENTLRQRESELLQAKSDLKLEMGRQEIARQDFQLFEDVLPDAGDSSLVLREPQLKAAEVRVESAQASVDQAKLDLERTAIKAPFNAQVLSRNADLGSQVARGASLARIVDADTYWVMATVPLSKLPFLRFRDEGEEGAPVMLRHKASWPEGLFREGRLFKLTGTLEQGTRLARVVIEVKDPLARRPESKGLPPLLISEFLEVHIEGRDIKDVVKLDRAYVRNKETAWVMDDESQLQIRPLEIIFKDGAHAYVRDGLKDGDRIVTTHLSTVTDGADLKLVGSEEAPEPGGNE